VLALRAFGNVLQNVALNLHAAAILAVIRNLDQSVEVVIGR